MIIDEYIAGRLLLKQIPVARLLGQRFAERIRKAHEEPILVEVIIGDLFSQINEGFILNPEIRHARPDRFSFRGI